MMQSYVLCCQKRTTITICGECRHHFYAESIDTQTCGDNAICQAHEKSHALMLNSAILPCATCFALKVDASLWEGKSELKLG